MHTRISNPICSLKEKLSVNIHALWRGKIWYNYKLEKNSWIISVKVKRSVPSGLLLILVTISTSIKKQNHLWLLINHY